MGCACGGTHEDFNGKWYEYGMIRNALIAGVIGIAAFICSLFGVNETVVFVMYLIAVLIAAYLFIIESKEELFDRHKIGINILMVAAAAGALAIGLPEESLMLLVLCGIGEGLEGLTFSRTHQAITSLYDRTPKTITLIKDGSEVAGYPADAVMPEMIFSVRTGEGVATDGVVETGTVLADESVITGESVPVEKNIGDSIVAGSIIVNGYATVKATASFNDNTVSRIIHMVEEAQERKGNFQRFIEKFGDKYSPVILVGALLMFAAVPFFGYDIGIRAVAFLIAATPCALIIATPIATAAGIGTAGRSGILIKGGIHLERLGTIKAVAFDKTGTLTTGVLKVTDVVGNPETADIAAALEQGSVHPIAKAILAYKTPMLSATNFSEVAGSCIEGKVDGALCTVGKTGTFPLSDELSRKASHFRSEGKTVVAVSKNSEVIGLIAVQDTIRVEAATAVKSLKDAGYPVIMLTGDHPESAKAVSGILGISDVRAGLSPKEKLDAIEELEKKYGPVAMVGDGINDAPALSTATVGIAAGAGSTATAIEAADVVLMGSDVRLVDKALKIGSKANRIGKQNVIFSCVALAIMIPLSLLGFLSVLAAVILHEVTEMIAIGNGLRVLKSDPGMKIFGGAKKVEAASHVHADGCSCGNSHHH